MQSVYCEFCNRSLYPSKYPCQQKILMYLFQLFSNAAQMKTAERTNAASSWQEVVLKSTEEASHVHQTWVFQTQERTASIP